MHSFKIFVKTTATDCTAIFYCFFKFCALWLLFFLAFAQVSSSVYSDGFRWRIPAFGYSAAVIAFSLSIARLIYSLVNGADALNIEHPFNITDLAFAFFAVTLILVVTKKSEKECSEQVVSKN